MHWYHRYISFIWNVKSHSTASAWMHRYHRFFTTFLTYSNQNFQIKNAKIKSRRMPHSCSVYAKQVVSSNSNLTKLVTVSNKKRKDQQHHQQQYQDKHHPHHHLTSTLGLVPVVLLSADQGLTLAHINSQTGFLSQYDVSSSIPLGLFNWNMQM